MYLINDNYYYYLLIKINIFFTNLSGFILISKLYKYYFINLIINLTKI